MRFFILTLLISFSPFSIAQGMPPGMQEAMDCMNAIDQKALKDMGDEAMKMSDEIKALCKKGDESAAKDAAIGYAKEIANKEQMVKIRECSELMRKAMPTMQIPQYPSVEEYEDKADSICEDIE